MDSFTRMIKKNKKRSTLLLSLIFLLFFILILHYIGDEFSTSNWISFFCWYVIFLNSIWVDPKEDFPMYIYFSPKWEKEISQKIREMGFRESSRNAKKIVFKKKRKWIFYYRIRIKKNKEKSWRIGGRTKFIKNLEDYRLRYISRGFFARKNIGFFIILFTALSLSSF